MVDLMKKNDAMTLPFTAIKLKLKVTRETDECKFLTTVTSFGCPLIISKHFDERLNSNILTMAYELILYSNQLDLGLI